MRRSNQIALIVFIAIIVTSFSHGSAAELEVPYISKGACPFEGCTYGKWPVLKRVEVYADPNLTSDVVTVLNTGEEVMAVTGDVYVVPGRAMIVGEPHRSAVDLDRNKEILILDYVGEGYSRVFQNGRYSLVKIARSKAQCQENPSWRYCWVEVLQDAVSQWWVFVKTLDGKYQGWVLMEGGVLEPIDRFS